MAEPVIIFYPFYISDHARKASNLSITEEGALRRLLDAYYAQRGPFANDLAVIARHARPENQKERATVIAIIERFFPLAPDGLRHNARADVEIVIALKRMETARVNGGKGGRKPGANPAGSPAGKQPAPQRDSYSQSQSDGDGVGGPLKGPHHTEQGIGLVVPPPAARETPSDADPFESVRAELGTVILDRLFRESKGRNTEFDAKLGAIAGLNASGASWDDLRDRVTQLLDTGRGVSWLTLFGERSASSPTESAR